MYPVSLPNLPQYLDKSSHRLYPELFPILTVISSNHFGPSSHQHLRRNLVIHPTPAMFRKVRNV
ncbi:hypothetical protein M404DRAFT_334534 [Pisolithus tinctorius Marx 270]|uniref:Uncharacterized protein n=1 Tax=Pisolithus tinctorius Marx 270 TaxID=870435 RepID=A0A0C3JBJ8_PISTI|nr:hypothetical protein M404DRAFT_334534 [Pisolithus tinctorius Marx 270]